MAELEGRPRLRLSPSARRDIREVLAWTGKQFGDDATSRYYNLIRQAIADIVADPTRIGAMERPEIAPGIWTYHLVHSRKKVGGGPTVKHPRHLLVYRHGPDRIELVRVLQDARDLIRPVPDVTARRLIDE